MISFITLWKGKTKGQKIDQELSGVMGENAYKRMSCGNFWNSGNVLYITGMVGFIETDRTVQHKKNFTIC